MSTVLSRSQGGSIYDSAEIRIQKEIEVVTRKLELEKRKYQQVDEQYLKLWKELQTKRKDLGPGAKTEDPIKNKKRVKVLENRLEMAVTKFNATLATNRLLRETIDYLRRERKSYDAVFKALDRELQLKRDGVKQVMQSGEDANLTNAEMMLQIEALKRQAEEERILHEAKFRDLEEALLEEKKLRDEQMRTLTKSLLQSARPSGGDSEDSGRSLANKIQKETMLNAMHRKAIETFQQNIYTLEEAFAKIKEATGITDIDEIVTTFIKSEEQNYSLYNYVNDLNAEIDQMEEANRSIMRQMGMFQEQGNDAGKKRSEILSSIEEQIKRTQESIAEKDGEYEDIRQQVASLTKPIEHLYAKLAARKLDPEVDSLLVLEEEGVTDQNVLIYLTTLDTCLSELLALVADEERNSAPPAGKIPPKEFDKVPLFIEPPTTEDLSSEEDDDDESSRRPFTRVELKGRTLQHIEKRKHASSKPRGGNKGSKTERSGMSERSGIARADRSERLLSDDMSLMKKSSSTNTSTTSLLASNSSTTSLSPTAIKPSRFESVQEN
eukprot:GILI01008256.1.p1 GENE.GILI01008256.1~~GILI01008256.1.p1  ORF type:complete len:552 (+),score=155.61 GILI01008256.1:120-1775(+)